MFRQQPLSFREYNKNNQTNWQLHVLLDHPLPRDPDIIRDLPGQVHRHGHVMDAKTSQRVFQRPGLAEIQAFLANAVQPPQLPRRQVVVDEARRGLGQEQMRNYENQHQPG